MSALIFQGFGRTLRSLKEAIANWTRLSHKIGLQTGKGLRMKKFCYDSLNPSWSPEGLTQSQCFFLSHLMNLAD